MGKGCSRPRVQGFEIFEESASLRTAPEGKPAEEPCSEGASTETNVQYCASYQEKFSKKGSNGKPFLSECNLVVSLPLESTSNGIDSTCHQSSETRPAMQSQATQTPSTDTTVKRDDRQKIDNLTPRGCNDVPVNETDYRRTKKKRRRRLQQRPIENELCGSDPDLISAYIKERLELIALEGDRFLGKSESQVQDTNRTEDQTNRKMRPRRRHSMLDKNNLANDLPTRDVTYPGACLPSDDANDINSLIVEPGSECSTKLWLPYRNQNINKEGFVKQQDRVYNQTENSTRCPCARKHSPPRNSELKSNTHEEPRETLPNRRTKRRKPKPTDGNRHDSCYGNSSAMTAQKIKIDRSCLCDRDNNDDMIDSLGCCRREIVMRHEHHHYHHYPKSRSKTNRRHTFKI